MDEENKWLVSGFNVLQRSDFKTSDSSNVSLLLFTSCKNLLLNNETSRYVFRILAVKNIIENPKYYGFQLTEKDNYLHIPTYTVSVDTAVTNWADFAHQHDINYKILKRYNPWLRQNYLTNSKRKVYSISIPHKGYYIFQSKNSTESIE